MRTILQPTLLALALIAGAPAAARAQAPDPSEAAAADSSSERVEESDEAYRRRMELEDARDRDPLLNPTVDVPSAPQEKIDKLPQASQDNIRDQVIDVIMQNDEWEPFDALREYPYTPTEAAQRDPDLLEREQAAWDEQIEKYHQREAAAHNARRGPQPGPGNPDGPEGGAGEGSAGQQASSQGATPGAGQGEGADGGEGEGQDAGGGSPGTYQPSRTSAEDAVSTAGVQQSALDFLQGAQGATQGATQSATRGDATQEADTSAAEAPEPPSPATPTVEVTTSSPVADESPADEDDLRGLIAIEDLDKLEDSEADGSADRADSTDG